LRRLKLTEHKSMLVLPTDRVGQKLFAHRIS